MDKVDWYFLSMNPNAIPIMENNMGKVKWSLLPFNTGIFELDMDFIKTRMDILREELIQKVFHPTRVIRIYNECGYNILEDEMIEMDEY